MQYLLASDLHYALPQLDWIAEQAGDFDAVVLAGDHLDLAGRVDLTAQIALWRGYLAELATTTTVIVNSGNHDLSARLDHGEKVAAWLQELDPQVVTDGGSITLGTDLVSSCAWWEGPVTQADMIAQLDADRARRPSDGYWIWVYHSPPDGSPTAWTGARHFGDDVLNRLIDSHRPDVVLAGHVHEAPFRPDGSWFDLVGSSLVLNAGRQPGPIPAHVIIDTDEGTAMSWTFEHGSRHVDLPDRRAAAAQ